MKVTLCLETPQLRGNGRCRMIQEAYIWSIKEPQYNVQHEEISDRFPEAYLE